MDTCEIERFINKLPICNSESFYVLNSTWKSNKVLLEIVDFSPEIDVKEWTGLILIDDMKKSAIELEIPYKNFYQECKQALTMNNGIPTFSYGIQGNKFLLRKIEKFKIIYLETNIVPASNLSRQLLFESVDTITSTKRKIIDLQLEVKNMNHEYEAIVTAFEDCVQAKNKLEQNLLNKFLSLLNSKKNEIEKLHILLRDKTAKITEIKRKLNNNSNNDSVEKEESDSIWNVTDVTDMYKSESEGIGDSNHFAYLQPTQKVPTPTFVLAKRQKFDSINCITKTVHDSKSRDIPSTSKQDYNITNVETIDSENMFENM